MRLGWPWRIDEKVHLLKEHRPYHESDHVLNIAYNALCGGQTLDDIELRRQDRRCFSTHWVRKASADPTTEGDFCRRFEEDTNLIASRGHQRDAARGLGTAAC